MHRLVIGIVLLVVGVIVVAAQPQTPTGLRVVEPAPPPFAPTREESLLRMMATHYVVTREVPNTLAVNSGDYDATVQALTGEPPDDPDEVVVPFRVVRDDSVPIGRPQWARQ